MAVQTQIQWRRGTASSWTSTNPTLAAGEVGYETDTGKYKVGNGSSVWTSLAYAGGATAVTYLFNATSGQTTFSGADANGLTLAYTVGAEQVYLNGVLQVRGSDYTATNGTSIVLASGALTSDVLNVIAYSAMTITDTYTQAQADAKFVQNANNTAAAKNFAINGGLDIWQRGTSFTATGYSADRWYTTSTSMTISRQSTNAPVGSQYYLRNTATAGSASSDSFMYFESSQTAPLVGRTITISVKVRRNATFNQDLFFRLDKSATVDAGSGATWTNITPISGSNGTSNFDTNASITTGTGVADWTTIYRTLTIPSDGTANSIRVIIYYGNVVPSGSEINYAQLQVEIGSVVTSFARAGGTIAGELAACQRYYFRNGGSSLYETMGSGMGKNANYASIFTQFPVTMRIVPTSMDYSTLGLFDGVAIVSGTPGLALNSAQSSRNGALTEPYYSGGGLTAYRPYQLIANAYTGAYIGFSAEL